MTLLSAFIPIDRRQTLFRRRSLPVRSRGAAMIADLARFTPLSAALVDAWGPEKGAEEITRTLSLAFTQLIAEVHQMHGSVIGFSGDALTCWFGNDDGRRAVYAGLRMQASMEALDGIRLPDGRIFPLEVKVTAAAGEATRLLVGDPHEYRLEVLTGAAISRLAAGARHTRPGEVLVDEAIHRALKDDLQADSWRTMPDGARFVCARSLNNPPRPHRWEATLPFFREEVTRPWILPAVYARLQTQSDYLGGELRPVVSMFVNLEPPEPEDEQYSWLDGYVRWVQRILHRYEGALFNINNDDKGLHLHIVFGAPLAHADDVLRALSTAQALMAPPKPHRPRVRVGIARGRAYAGAYGSIARQCYDVLGETVNLAARLMEAAPPGGILCDQNTFQAARKHWKFESLPPIAMKGRAAPVHAYRPQTPRRQHAAQPLNAMVGREEELGVLHTAFAQMQQGAVRLVLIEGEAGIGKSRLLRAWLGGPALSGQRVLTGAGQSIEQHTPYRAWYDVLAAFFGLHEDMPAAGRRERVRAWVQEHAPEQMPRLPLLNELLRVDFPHNELTDSLTPTLRQQNLVILVGALLHSAPGPLVLVFDDAHWMDSLSWELLLKTVHTLQARRRPALLVVSLRPLDASHPRRTYLSALSEQPGVQRLRLRSLPPHAMRALIASRLGVPEAGLPAPLVRLVQRRGGGNPFYVEELLHTLREKRLIWVEQTIQGPRCILSADFERASQTIPPTLQGLILARIDKMPPERQLVLKVASVIGRTFAYALLRDALQDILPSVLSNLRQELELLSEQDLTQEETPAPNLTYVFKHIITQETSYQTLLFSQRRRLHRMVAEWYERHFQPEDNGFLPPLLVHHYHHAEEREKEKRYARMAGEQALEQHAHSEALAYFRRALELTPPTEGEARFQILLGLEECHHWMGNRKAQENILREIETAAALMQRRHWQAEGALRRARYGRAVGDYEAVITAAKQVLALFPQTGFHRYKAQAHYEWGNALWQHGAYDEAMRHLEQALHLNDHQPNSPISVLALKGLGALYNERGENENARTCYEQALRIARRIGDRRGEAAALGNLGNLLSDQGDHLQARELYLQALEIYRQVASWRAQSMVLNNLGALAYYLGNYAEAQDFYEQSLHIKWKIQDRPGEGMTLANLGGLFYAMGDYGNALAYSDKALEILRDLSLPFWEALALQWRGDTYLALQDWPQAVETFSRCVELRRAQGHTAMLMESLAGLAAAQAGGGNLEAARAALDEVLPRLNEAALEGAVDPLRVYWRVYETLRALDSPKARAVLKAGCRLLSRRARAIRSKPERRAFLRNVPEHRALLEARACLPRGEEPVVQD